MDLCVPKTTDSSSNWPDVQILSILTEWDVLQSYKLCKYPSLTSLFGDPTPKSRVFVSSCFFLLSNFSKLSFISSRFPWCSFCWALRAGTDIILFSTMNYCLSPSLLFCILYYVILSLESKFIVFLCIFLLRHINQDPAFGSLFCTL